MRATSTRSRAGRRLAVAAAISVGAVLTAMVVPSGSLSLTADETRGEADGYKKAYVAAAKNERSAAQGSGTIFNADGSHIHAGNLDGHSHDHSDPRTKNAVSRAAVTTNRETEDPTTPAQARLAVGAAEEQRYETEPKLSNVPVSASHASSPTNRYNMFNACYGVQSARTSRWLTGATTPTFTATSIGAGAPLYFKPTELGRYMLYSRARTFLDGGQPAVSYAANPGPSSNWVATMPKSGLFRFQIPGKGYLADTGSKATVTSTGHDVPAAPAQRLHGLPRDQHQRLRQPVLRSERDPGGPRLHRCAHPRHGLRVPGRTGALRPALVAVRRGAGPEGLPGPRDHRGQGRGDGGVPVQQADPRPGRLADLQGLARAGVTDPRGHLLQVDGALLARRPTAPGEPARREQQALRALPAQAQQLQRHGLDPPAGEADAQPRELRRRAARWSRQGLVPHRHHPRPGPERHQRRQAGRGDGHRDLCSLRLHPEARRS